MRREAIREHEETDDGQANARLIEWNRSVWCLYGSVTSWRLFLAASRRLSSIKAAHVLARERSAHRRASRNTVDRSVWGGKRGLRRRGSVTTATARGFFALVRNSGTSLSPRQLPPISIPARCKTTRRPCRTSQPVVTMWWARKRIIQKYWRTSGSVWIYRRSVARARQFGSK